jgi:hypothetical protein
MSDAMATLLSGGILALLVLAGAIYKLGQSIGELKGLLTDISDRIGDLEDWRSALRHGGGLVPQAPGTGQGEGQQLPRRRTRPE